MGVIGGGGGHSKIKGQLFLFWGCQHSSVALFPVGWGINEGRKLTSVFTSAELLSVFQYSKRANMCYITKHAGMVIQKHLRALYTTQLHALFH